MNKNPDWKLTTSEGITPELARQISEFRKNFDIDQSRQVRTSAPEYYIWKFNDNPVDNGCVAMGVSDDRIVGVHTCTWRHAYYKGKKYKAAKLGDAFTLKRFTGRGINTSLGKSCRDWALSRGADFIYFNPNEFSLPVATKLNLIDHPHINYYFWLLPIKSSGLIKSDRFKALKKAADVTTKGIYKALSHQSKKGLELTGPDFDNAFDTLNTDLSRRFAFYFDKSAAYLRYRYAENPDRKLYRVVTYRNPNLKSVLIFKDTIQWGLRVISVVDWYGSDSSSMRKVWLKFVRTACEESYDMAAAWFPMKSAFIRSMLPAGALPYKSKTWTIYDNQTGRQLLNEKSLILFTATEADFI